MYNNTNVKVFKWTEGIANVATQSRRMTEMSLNRYIDYYHKNSIFAKTHTYCLRRIY